MIQLPALPTTPGSANIAEILGNSRAESGNGSDFGTLLAVQIITEPALPVLMEAAIPTPALPVSGKILPPLLQLTEQSLPAPVEAAIPSDRLSDILTALSPALPAAEQFIKPKEAIPEPVRAVADPVQIDIAPAAPKDEEPKPPAMSDANAPIPSASPPFDLSAALPVLPVQPGPLPFEYSEPNVRNATPQPETPYPPATKALIAEALTEAVAPASLASTEPVLLPLEHPLTGSLPVPLRSDLPPVQQEILTRVPIGPATGPLQAKQPLPDAPQAAVPPLRISAELVQPIAQPPGRSAASLQIRPASRPGDIPISPVIHSALPGLELAAEASATLRDAPFLQQFSTMAELRLTGPTSTLPALAAVRPLDFTALVDRLVQARDAVAPQTVTLALSHADFGKVSLRFEQDDAGLSVSIASPDPDFARAASAAIPPERALPAEQQSQSSRHQSASSDTAGQSRNGANPERRDERATPRPNPGQTPRHHAERTGRSDIFA